MMDLDGSLTYRFLASIFEDFLYVSLQCHFSSNVCYGKKSDTVTIHIKNLQKLMLMERNEH